MGSVSVRLLCFRVFHSRVVHGNQIFALVPPELWIPSLGFSSGIRTPYLEENYEKFFASSLDCYF